MGLAPAAEGAEIGKQGRNPGSVRAQEIPGEYIVTLASGADLSPVIARAERRGARVDARYRHALTGFAARMSETAAAALRRDPRVKAVDPNRVFRAFATQASPPWGLDRLDQPKAPLDRTYNYGRPARA